MKAKDLSSVLGLSECCIPCPDALIETLLTDSRKADRTSVSLFFAIPTMRNNGCRYVADLYQRGVRNFVLPQQADAALLRQLSTWGDANYWLVPDVVAALQQVAASHRAGHDIPVVGITGSNGKTVVKDWLVQLLSSDHSVAASPRSYNSQIGVPLSVWSLQPHNDLALFEAGISQPGEMDALRRVIQPTIGIFTNVGSAHDENFVSRKQKTVEKMSLFSQCEVLVYCSDMQEIRSAVESDPMRFSFRSFTWGTSDQADVRLHSTRVEEGTTTLDIVYRQRPFSVTIPFEDAASAENAMHCVSLMLYLGYAPHVIAERCRNLTAVQMRLSLAEGINGCQLVNDAYSLDIDSLTMALDYLQREQQLSKALIMSDFVQSGIPENQLYAQVAQLLEQRSVRRFVGIGPVLCRNQHHFASIPLTNFFHTTEEFLSQFPFGSLRNEALLLKGARCFHFENIAKELQEKSHQTVMEVNIDALINNLNYYRSLLNPTTRLMAMVKASSYGAGKVEVASALQYHHVDYLTVAYSDEGVELRRNGITVPIMVMNPEEDSFEDIIRYHLEPDIYSFRILDLFSQAVLSMGEQRYPIHIELDTGMHRLGFDSAQVDALALRLQTHAPERPLPLEVRSVFSHLACSEDPAMDDFTRLQISRFSQGSQQLKNFLGQPDLCCHILNSSGIARFPEAQMDMVRLGIGLYGIAPQPEVQQHLMPVSRLVTRISQIKEIPCGDSVGYNRRWVAQRNSRIAILSIGYADGLSRRLGNGNGTVLVGDHPASIIGSICMDMCFLDVTDIPCEEGDPVVIFGDADLLQQVSSAAGTIPYEVLTSVSPRVKRIYYQE